MYHIVNRNSIQYKNTNKIQRNNCEKAKVGNQLEGKKINRKNTTNLFNEWNNEKEKEQKEERKANETGYEIRTHLTKGTLVGVADGYII
jgi:F0F1-type ATP synthase assembly protein I